MRGDRLAYARHIPEPSEHTVVEYGPGTGALALAAAEVCQHVFAVDVAPAMLAYAKRRATAHAVHNMSFHHAGFLTYAHAAAPVDWVLTQFAFHHLPDFWKGVALTRINQQLRLGGRFVLRDVIFSFAPADYANEIEHWITEQAAGGSSFSRHEFEMHVREEHSTCAWLLEALLNHTWFRVDSFAAASPVYGLFVCTKIGDVEAGAAA